MNTSALRAALGGDKEDIARSVALQIQALRELTATTGTKTTRTQNDLLQALPDDILLQVAVLLKVGV